jgi:hypothetical protein
LPRLQEFPEPIEPKGLLQGIQAQGRAPGPRHCQVAANHVDEPVVIELLDLAQGEAAGYLGDDRAARLAQVQPSA